MTAAEEVPALSIGAVLGNSDAESRLWQQAVRGLMKDVMQSRGSASTPLAVNVVFHIDGKLVPNEFEGVRTGRYDTAKRHLMVQAAVPSGGVDDRRAVLVGLLMEAVEAAETFARRRGLADDLAQVREVAHRAAGGG